MTTKTHALDRQLTHLRNQRMVINDEITDTNRIISNAICTRTMLEARLDVIKSDIATTEQLIIDLFPEPRD